MKHPVTRTSLLLTVLALVVVMAGGCGRGGGASGGENYAISFSHVVTPTTQKGMGAERFKELVEQKSDGRITVEVYPNSELYGDEDEIRAVIGETLIHEVGHYFGLSEEQIEEIEARYWRGETLDESEDEA